MSKKNQVQNTEKKKNDCGCGCIGITEKKAKVTKLTTEKPKQ